MIKSNSLKVLLLALIVSYGAGFIGSIFTSGEVDSEWYNSVKPIITPPDYVFPIVWNLLFLLIALSIWIVWMKSNNKLERRKIVYFYGLNLIANILWSLFYFKMHNPLLAFIDLIVILITIILTIRTGYYIDKRGAWLLYPYLIWIIYAGLLNFLSIK